MNSNLMDTSKFNEYIIYILQLTFGPSIKSPKTQNPNKVKIKLPFPPTNQNYFIQSNHKPNHAFDTQNRLLHVEQN